MSLRCSCCCCSCFCYLCFCYHFALAVFCFVSCFVFVFLVFARLLVNKSVPMNSGGRVNGEFCTQRLVCWICFCFCFCIVPSYLTFPLCRRCCALCVVVFVWFILWSLLLMLLLLLCVIFCLCFGVWCFFYRTLVPRGFALFSSLFAVYISPPIHQFFHFWQTNRLAFKFVCIVCMSIF